MIIKSTKFVITLKMLILTENSKIQDKIIFITWLKLDETNKNIID